MIGSGLLRPTRGPQRACSLGWAPPIPQWVPCAAGAEAHRTLSTMRIKIKTKEPARRGRSMSLISPRYFCPDVLSTLQGHDCPKHNPRCPSMRCASCDRGAQGRSPAAWGSRRGCGKTAPRWGLGQRPIPIQSNLKIKKKLPPTTSGTPDLSPPYFSLSLNACKHPRSQSTITLIQTLK